MPTETYLDEQGRPILRQSVTAFLDILGFSHAVLQAAEEGKSQACLDEIVGALNVARAAVRAALSAESLSANKRWAVKFFSDNVLLGCPCDGADSAAAAMFVVECALHYQLQMALSGHFVRGAVTRGPLCVTDDMIFGTSLIESYQLEAKASIVPRIILAEPVFKAVAENAAAAELICRDIDGWWFVNYLQAAVGPAGIDWSLIKRHKDAVTATLPRSPRHDILPKFGWVSRYHNVFCWWHRDAQGFSDDYRIQRVDENSAIERWVNA